MDIAWPYRLSRNLINSLVMGVWTNFSNGRRTIFMFASNYFWAKCMRNVNLQNERSFESLNSFLFGCLCWTEFKFWILHIFCVWNTRTHTHTQAGAQNQLYTCMNLFDLWSCWWCFKYVPWNTSLRTVCVSEQILTLFVYEHVSVNRAIRLSTYLYVRINHKHTHTHTAHHTPHTAHNIWEKIKPIKYFLFIHWIPHCPHRTHLPKVFAFCFFCSFASISLKKKKRPCVVCVWFLHSCA